MPRPNYLLLSTLALVGLVQAHSSLRGPHKNASVADDEFYANSTYIKHVFRAVQETESSQFFQVPMFLALKYLDDEAASELETLNATNNFVDSFCRIVRQQAGGSQVNRAGNELGITITTANVTNNLIKSCILDTYRVYRPIPTTVGPGYFILELSFVQVVTATTLNPFNPLNMTIVRKLVEIGFDQSSGGRDMFLSLMQASSPNYLNMKNVVVLEKFSQASPTKSPSPSPFNSLMPTMLFSQMPSPSTRPTSSPSSTPTNQNTMDDSVSSTASFSNEQNDDATNETFTDYPVPTQITSTLVPSQLPSPSSLPTITTVTVAPSASPTMQPSERPSIMTSTNPAMVTTLTSLEGNPSTANDTVSPKKIAGIVIGFFVCLCIFQFLCSWSTSHLLSH